MTDDYETTSDLKDGLHFGVKFEDYLHWPILSQSCLKEGKRSMSHLRAAMEGERVKIPTDDMILGTAIHTCFLEPELAFDRIRVYTGGARRGKEWEAFKKDNEGRILLTENQGEKLAGMVASLRRHPEVRKWVGAITDVEVSCIGMVHKMRFKGRCDALTSEPMIDLKKCANGDFDKFIRQALELDYHIQAAIYCQLFNRDRFVFLTCEDDPPYDVSAYELSPAFIRAGDREARDLIEKVAECQESGIWPGRSSGVVQLELPEWADKASDVTFGGEAIE